MPEELRPLLLQVVRQQSSSSVTQWNDVCLVTVQPQATGLLDEVEQLG
ncbi:MAG: hypothetical protein AAGF75_04345 [Cyanobacteria bacterium P01_H01_bin.130]